MTPRHHAVPAVRQALAATGFAGGTGSPARQVIAGEGTMSIGNISGASALLSQLLNPNQNATTATSLVSAAPSTSSTGSSTGSSSVSGANATQDLQSFMSALIQELRQSGAAAGSVGSSTVSGSAPSSVAASQSGGHHGHGGHGGHGHGQVSTQLQSLLQELSGTSTTASSNSAASIVGSGSPASSSLQASFQRLMQDVKTGPNIGQMLRATA
jgi:hypothetical protein